MAIPRNFICFVLCMSGMVLGVNAVMHLCLNFESLLAYVPVADSMIREADAVFHRLRLMSIMSALSATAAGVLLTAAAFVAASKPVKIASIFIGLFLIICSVIICISI